MRSLWAALLGAALRTAAFESCAEARRYYEADELAEEARRLRAGRANVSRPLRFLHVPKNAGTTIQRLLPELRPRTTVLDGRTCGKCVKVGGPCACSLWHVPPRYLPRPMRLGRGVLAAARPLRSAAAAAPTPTSSLLAEPLYSLANSSPAREARACPNVGDDLKGRKRLVYAAQN